MTQPAELQGLLLTQREAEAHYATKADLQSLENRMLKWAFGIIAGIAVSVIGTVISAVWILIRLSQTN